MLSSAGCYPTRSRVYQTQTGGVFPGSCWRVREGGTSFVALVEDSEIRQNGALINGFKPRN
jgi:hypothetical protein